MGYFVKRCAGCGTENNPSDTTCRACHAMLPSQKVESDTRPPAPQNTAAPSAAQPAPPAHSIIKAQVIDINMPFLSMVAFMFKWAIAAIPVLIVLALLGAFLSAVISGMGYGPRIGASSYSPSLATDTTPAPAACSTDDIEPGAANARWEDPCKTNNCPHLAGTAKLVNHCKTPIGVLVKLTGYNAAGELVAVTEKWPASVSNIPPGEYVFSIDHWLEHDPAIASIKMSIARVRQW